MAASLGLRRLQSGPELWTASHSCGTPGRYRGSGDPQQQFWDLDQRGTRSDSV